MPARQATKQRKSPGKRSPVKRAKSSPKAPKLLQLQAATAQVPHFGLKPTDEAQIRKVFGPAACKLTPAIAKQIPVGNHFAALFVQTVDGIPDHDHKIDAIFDLQLHSKSADGRTVTALMAVPKDPFRIVTLTDKGGVLRFGGGDDPVYIFKN